MSMLRAFIAIELPPPIQGALRERLLPLKRKIGEGSVRWVPEQHIHITLKFLGDVVDTRVDFLRQMLARAADAHAPFEVKFGGLGSFPNPNRPRVLWVGLHAPHTLASLHQAVENGADRLGFEKERRAFSPHLTIGRVRQNLPPDEIDRIRSALASTQLGDIPPARVDAIHLFRSDLKPAGAEYAKLFSAKLKST
jgi:2'-5' RNA ligase